MYYWVVHIDFVFLLLLLDILKLLTKKISFTETQYLLTQFSISIKMSINYI